MAVNKMEERLERLMALYANDADSAPPSAGEGLSGPELEAELADWQAVKAMLDGRTRRSPRPETIAAVLAAARTERDAPFADRVARRSARVGARRIAYFGAAIAIVLAMWIVMRPDRGDQKIALVQPTTTSPAQSAGGEAPAVASLASDAREAPRLPQAPALSGTDPEVGEPSPVVAAEQETDDDGLFLVEDEDLSWDHSEEVREIYDRLEELYAISPPGSDWRNAPQRQTLAAPVGLVRPQQASAAGRY